jgi:hypothetical protein
MRENSKLNELLKNKKFEEAVSLLKDHLEKAEIIDPSNDKSWAPPYADLISRYIKSSKGQDASNDFWEELLKFFKDELEPTWVTGYLHKGHILFRLGLGTLVSDVSKAKTYLEEALNEDRLKERKKYDLSTPHLLFASDKDGLLEREREAAIEKGVMEYSSYAWLCIIERIEDEHFTSNTEKQKFFQLLSPSFDATIFKLEVIPELVQESIKRIVPREALEQTLEARQELDRVCAQQLQVATVSLAGALLENILLGILCYQLGRSTAQGKDILKVKLGSLLEEAISSKVVFPSDSIKATCQTIHIFRNRLHPGNELRQKYKLTPQVAVTLKILLDSALVDWATQIDATKGTQT